MKAIQINAYGGNEVIAFVNNANVPQMSRDTFWLKFTKRLLIQLIFEIAVDIYNNIFPYNFPLL